MNEVWNLDPLYKGFDDPAYASDMALYQAKVEAFTAFAQALPGMEPLAGLEQSIQWQEELSSLGRKLGGYANLRQSTNTRDSECSSQMGRIMGLRSRLAGPEAAVEAWIAALPDPQGLAAQSEKLSDYGYLLGLIHADSRYQLEGRGEEICARLSLSGGDAWSDMHQYLTSTVPVQYRGKTINLSAVRNLAYDPDPQVRKDAYEAELACYDRVKDAVAFALNSIKLETITDCQLRGHASPLERTLYYARMRRETLDAMLEAMDEYLPRFWQYLKAKARALGHENGLPWYDLFAPMGKTDKKFTTQQARDYLVELFATFDQELSEMVARAFDEAWIDFYPRDGKAGGAFCAGVPSIGQSRILTNFDGTFSDVVTLAHELGHAFHNQCIAEHRPLNKGYSMPVAETASTFNECVVMAAAIGTAGDKDQKLALIESQLQDATQIICDIYSRFRFEAAVFENRESRFMDAQALCDIMCTAQKSSYGDGLDHGCLHPYMWVCKGHYYGPTFYNFPYAFGGLFARGLYAQYEKEGVAFLPKYKKLLYTTTVASVEDTARVAGIDLTDKAFWRGALQTIADQIDLFCQLVEE